MAFLDKWVGLASTADFESSESLCGAWALWPLRFEWVKDVSMVFGESLGAKLFN